MKATAIVTDAVNGKCMAAHAVPSGWDATVDGVFGDYIGVPVGPLGYLKFRIKFESGRCVCADPVQVAY